MSFRKGLIAAVAVATSTSSSLAYELGSAGALQKPGITIGASAGDPPPGIYMFDQVFTYQANVAGPGNALLNPAGTKTGVQAAVDINGFLFAPGWTFLGATYTAVFAQPFAMSSVGSPVNAQAAGMYNSFIVPAELSWKLGDSGFFVKAGLGMYVPDGTVTGFNGLGNAGHPWWTFQPEFVVSYLKDGWNLSAFLYEEFNTKSTVTGYRSGDVLHADFTATKTIDKWTFGPVGYYVGQVSGDTSSAFYGNAINVNRYDVWAAGALVGYNFGPAALNVWAVNEFSARASGGTNVNGIDSATITKGFSVFASLSYRLWAPEEPAPAPKPSYYRK